MKNLVRKLVDDALPEIIAEFSEARLKTADLTYMVEAPKAKAHGDLSVNVAFHLAKLLNRSPYEIAVKSGKIIGEKVRTDETYQKCIRHIEVAQPGFINFSLTATSLASAILDIKRLDLKYGLSTAGKGKRVLIEFVSANPTGPLTIAHGRQAAVGDAIAHVLEAVGCKVHKEFYLNDCGRQIRLLGESLWVRYQELLHRNEEIPEEGYRGRYLVDVAEQLKREKSKAFGDRKKSEVLSEVTDFAVHAMLEGIKKDLADLRVCFDEFYSEGSLASDNKIEKVLSELRAKNLIYEAEDATWFRSTQFGDDKDRVLKKKNGDYTYLAPDVAYHQVKFKRGYTHLINLWGPDHHGYVTRLKAACQALGYQPEQLRILIVQLTTLYRNGEPIRMSTRAGEFVTLRELMDEVGTDATRFFFLMRKVDTHLDFDLELAKKKSDDNPVFYLQYAHARICSILKFAKQSIDISADLSLIQEVEAIDLIKKMLEYPDALIEAGHHIEPYRIADYLRELAALFHRFYAAHRIVSDEAPLTRSRLLLTDCVRIVLRNGLGILGIDAPSQM